jgi:hypothetical protein
MYEHGSLPRARQEGLLEETVGEELLLYDQNSHTAHCLSPIAACVWRHCDGGRGVTELAELAGASESLVADALGELREKHLLAAEPTLAQSTIPGESRREAIGRVARYGAAAAAGSMIVSATAATPAMASSSGFEESEQGFECVKEAGIKKNCCRCKKGGACADIFPSEAVCKSECEKTFGLGEFTSFTEQAQCVLK